MPRFLVQDLTTGVSTELFVSADTPLDEAVSRRLAQDTSEQLRMYDPERAGMVPSGALAGSVVSSDERRPRALYVSRQIPPADTPRLALGRHSGLTIGLGAATGTGASTTVDALLQDAERAAERRALSFATGIKRGDQWLVIKRQAKPISFP